MRYDEGPCRTGIPAPFFARIDRAGLPAICMITALGSLKNSRERFPRLAADAGGTYAAEGGAQVADEGAVHRHRATSKRENVVGGKEVFGVSGAMEKSPLGVEGEVALVGQVDDLVLAVEGVDHHDRAEELHLDVGLSRGMSTSTVGLTNQPSPRQPVRIRPPYCATDLT